MVTSHVRRGREPLSRLEGARIELTRPGRVVMGALCSLVDRFDGLRVDAKILMPDHLHAILFLSGSPHLPRDRRPTIPRIVQALKSFTTIRINRLLEGDGEPYWQRGFRDRVIRDEDDLWALRKHIALDPQRLSTKHRS